MKSVSPYLNFNGNCCQAMLFYKDVFGGELALMTFGDGPMEVPESAKDKIMHATLVQNGVVIMAADSNMPGQAAAIIGSNISLSIDCTSLDEIERYYASLAEGGQITMPIQDTFWGARFAMVTDKFGIGWLFNYEYPKEAK